MEELKVTDWVLEYVPAATEKLGVETVPVMTYAAVATLESAHEDLVAKALMVCDALTEIADV